MKSVGIRNLKNQLSKYLNMVRDGETVYVTDRDGIIAEIHKPVSAPGGGRQKVGLDGDARIRCPIPKLNPASARNREHGPTPSLPITNQGPGPHSTSGGAILVGQQRGLPGR